MARLKVSTKCHIALALVLFLFLVLTTLSVDSAKVSKTSFTSKTTAKTVPTTTTTTESSSSEDYYNPEDSREGNVSREDYAISDEPATSYQPGKADQPDPFEHIELLLPNKSGNGRSLPQTSYLNDEPSELSGINADLPEISEDDFCADNYVDAAYYNGYDLILTRGDRLYYYFKDEHRLSPPYKQSKFTQGDHIQGAFNISRIPDCRRSSSSLSSSTSVSSSTSSSLSSKIHDGDCSEISKMKGMAVYFLHNKDRARSYYNLDFRNRNGTQKRVRSRDLPWAMKQVGLLGGNMWPNGWESYQQHRPVAFLPSRYELIFIQNHFHESENGSFDHDSYRSSTSALLTWNTLDTDQWNTSWKSRIIVSPYPITYTGMFEMNGIVYAIGEHRLIDRNGNIRRIGKMFRYYVTEDDGRNLREMDQSVADFFGCPRIISDDYEDGEEGGEDEENSTEGPIPTVVQPPNLVSSSTVSPTSTTTATSTTTTTTPEPTTRKLITTTTSTTSTTTTTTATTPKPTSTTTTTTTTTPKSSTTTTKPKQSSKKPKSRQSLEGESSENSLESNDTITARRKPSSDVFLTSANSVFLRNSKAKIFPLAPSNNVSNVLNVASTPLNFRESDSILLTIFIGIVISACVATIILAFLTISGKTRSRRKMPPRFEGARIERTIPKPTIIGIDYHPRKNSSASGLNHMNLMTRYDSMNSINAIYSQIKKPILSSNPVAHASLQHQRSLSMRNPNPYGMAGMGCSENRLHGYASPPNSGGVSTFSRPSHNISSPSSRRQNGQPPHSHTQFGGSFHNFDLFN